MEETQNVEILKKVEEINHQSLIKIVAVYLPCSVPAAILLTDAFAYTSRIIKKREELISEISDLENDRVDALLRNAVDYRPENSSYQINI